MSTHAAGGFRQPWTRITSAYYLRLANRVGSGAVVRGRPWLSNAGRLDIGHGFRLSSSPALSHLFVGTAAKLTIGDRVTISYGAAVSANQEVSIGDDTRVGPFCVIMDSDYHAAADRSGAAETAPVAIGKRVVIGSRVTILRGSTIGDGAQLLGGSVVSGAIAADAIVAGVPARRVRGAGEQRDGEVAIPELVARVLGLTRPPALDDGPLTLREWDSLGSLKLLLALEEAFDVTVPEEDMRGVASVAGLIEMMGRALQHGRGPSA